jgi:DNA-binding transcriptional LysR family regulator
MNPTVLALELLEPLHAALKDLEVLIRRRPRFDATNDVRDFRIATTDNGVAVIGLPLLQRLKAEAGAGIRLAFRPIDQSGPATQVDRDEIDLFIAPPSMVPAMLKSRRLYDETYSMVQRKFHPRGDRQLDLDAYCALDHILVSLDGGGFEGRVDRVLMETGRSRRVSLSMPSFTLVPAVLRTTDYVCTMPTRFVRTLDDHCECFELPFPAPGFEMHMAWHPRHHHDPANLWLRQQVLATTRFTTEP